MTFLLCRAKMKHRNVRTCKVCVSIAIHWLQKTKRFCVNCMYYFALYVTIASVFGINQL